MYIPQAFEEKRTPVLHDLIDAHPFCALVTVGDGGIFASHIPMILERGGGPLGVLHGHVSRANPQWRDFNPHLQPLAIFSGPQHYISPSWYPEKQEHGKVVPTWNYVTVHAYGELTAVEDPQWLAAHLHQLTERHEAEQLAQWKISDAPADYIAGLSRGIVGLRLSVTKLEGKWKVSQNRSERDRRGVIEALGKLGDTQSLAMRDLIRRQGCS